MIKILAPDGLDVQTKERLELEGFSVDINPLSNEDLINQINNYQVLVVRSATKVNATLINKMKTIKLIIRAGVGMDNIDIDSAKKKGIKVTNTPKSSSRSVAELVFAYIFASYREIHRTDNEMKGNKKDFKTLKKNYASGIELKDKKIGIIGFGRIGQEVGKMALGLEMTILPFDPYCQIDVLKLNIGNQAIAYQLKYYSLETILSTADIISLHIPALIKPIVTLKELKQMKKDIVLINCSRGGVIDESDLLTFLDTKHLKYACLDVFENEPHPQPTIYQHPCVIASPHIGASTLEAQKRVGIEVGNAILDYFRLS